MESILQTVKKAIPLPEEYDNFDTEIIMHINSVFMILHQLGAGPGYVFQITDDTATWTDFLGGNPNLEAIKTYMCAKVKLLFDPPMSSVVMEALKYSISELEWRINDMAESKLLKPE